MTHQCANAPHQLLRRISISVADGTPSADSGGSQRYSDGWLVAGDSACRDYADTGAFDAGIGGYAGGNRYVKYSLYHIYCNLDISRLVVNVLDDITSMSRTGAADNPRSGTYLSILQTIHVLFYLK